MAAVRYLAPATLPSLQAAITAAATASNATIDMSCLTSIQHLATQLTIAAPVKIQGCNVTISEEMADPGQSSGGILITSDHVTFQGASKACTILRATSAGVPVQNQIYSGTQNDVRFEQCDHQRQRS